MAKNELSTKDENRVNLCQKQLKNGVHLNIKVKFSEHEKGKHTFLGWNDEKISKRGDHNQDHRNNKIPSVFSPIMYICPRKKIDTEIGETREKKLPSRLMIPRSRHNFYAPTKHFFFDIRGFSPFLAEKESSIGRWYKSSFFVRKTLIFFVINFFNKIKNWPPWRMWPKKMEQQQFNFYEKNQ